MGEFVKVIRYSHECSVNHDGFASSIDVKGTVECFNTSMMHRIEYLADGVGQKLRNLKEDGVFKDLYKDENDDNENWKKEKDEATKIAAHRQNY